MKQRTTNKSNNRSSKLDIIYTKENIQIHKMQQLAQTLSFTDHIAVIAHIKYTHTVKLGKGYCKLNSTLLTNETYITNIKHLAHMFTHTIPQDCILNLLKRQTMKTEGK